MSIARPTAGISLNRRQYHFGWSQAPRNPLAHAIHVNCPDPVPPEGMAAFWPKWRGYW